MTRASGDGRRGGRVTNHGPTGGTHDAAYDRLVRSYYTAWFRYHPEAAVDAGVSGYAHLLTPFTEEELGALVCLNNELVVGLEELDRGQLTPDQAIDWRVLYGAARLENQYLLDVHRQRPDPEQLLPVHAIYQLLIRPVDDFGGVLRARLEAVPAYLQGVRDYLVPRASGIPALWLQTAITAARRGAEFVAGLVQEPRVAQSAAADAIDTAASAAAAALVTHAEFMQGTLSAAATGRFACGRSYFDNLMAQRHFLDVTSEQLYAFGERLVAQTEADLRAVSRELTGSEDYRAAIAVLQTDHPSAGELLEVYRAQMQAARDFVIGHRLVSAPSIERLDVVATPAFLRHQIPFAAYSEPSPSDREQRGLYYLTPPETDEQLAEHDRASIMHTCVHEAWPGHHLQFVTANLNPPARSLPRLLNPSATLYEGWALYCEQLMQEQGFLNRPEQRLILLRDRLWRALRILIDIDLHVRDLSAEAAAERLVSRLGFPRSQALADITWYTRSPAVPFGYATGWRLINALREQQPAADSRPALREFHDRLLSAGSIGLPLVIEHAFGASAWQRVRASVFGST